MRLCAFNSPLPFMCKAFYEDISKDLDRPHRVQKLYKEVLDYALRQYANSDNINAAVPELGREISVALCTVHLVCIACLDLCCETFHYSCHLDWDGVS